MFRKAGVLAAICIALLAPRAVAQPSITDTERSTVRVAVIADNPSGRFLYGTGSGFVVGERLIVTNAHVVAAARSQPEFSIAIVPPEGETMVPARIIRYSAISDLALLEYIGGPDLPPATISLLEPHAGDAIIALGFPDVDDLERPAADLVRPTPPSRTTGSIASLRDRAPTGDPIPTINHEAAISSGSSGGSLLDECGRIIGVNTWHTRGAETGEGRGVATRASQLIDFLEEAGVTPVLTDQRCLTFQERIAAERTATVEALEEQNRALTEKLEMADRLTRVAVIILIGGTLALFVAVGVLGALLLSRRHHLAPPHEAPHHEVPHPQADHHHPHKRGALGVAAVIGGATVAAILVTAAGVAFLRAQSKQPTEPAENAFIGTMQCTFDAEASKAANGVGDTSFTVVDEMCVNGRTLYAQEPNGGRYQRALLSGDTRTIDVLTIDPVTGLFSRDRHPLSDASYAAALEAAGAPTADGCSGAGAQQAVANRNEALLRFTGDAPSQRIVWHCTRREDAAE